jgi:hypothetical protein
VASIDREIGPHNCTSVKAGLHQPRIKRAVLAAPKVRSVFVVFVMPALVAGERP